MKSIWNNSNVRLSYPGGIIENSPAFQRRVTKENEKVPEGRLKGCIVKEHAPPFSRPFGTRLFYGANPALKRRAIVICPSGTKLSITHKVSNWHDALFSLSSGRSRRRGLGRGGNYEERFSAATS